MCLYGTHTGTLDVPPYRNNASLLPSLASASGVPEDMTLPPLSCGDGLVIDNEGTHAFFAPECCTGMPYDPKPVDVWAAGVTLYTWLFGQVRAPLYRGGVGVKAMSLFCGVPAWSCVCSPVVCASVRVWDCMRVRA